MDGMMKDRNMIDISYRTAPTMCAWAMLAPVSGEILKHGAVCRMTVNYGGGEQGPGNG